MKTKLILQLSLFGLAMAIGTVYVIPSAVEPFLWLPIFLVCAYVIAKKCEGKYFLHGFLTSLVNCVWIVGVHVLLFDAYAARHEAEMAMMAQGPMATHPRLMMVLTGPLIGVVSGLVLGLFAFIASKLVKKG